MIPPHIAELLAGLGLPTEVRRPDSEAPAPVSAADGVPEMPLSVRALAAGGAFLAGALFLVFLVAAGFLTTRESALGFGAAFLALAVLLSWLAPRGPLLESVLPALFLPGQVLFHVAYATRSHSASATGIVGFFVSLVLFVALRSQLQRLLSVVLAFGFLALFFHDLHF